MVRVEWPISPLFMSPAQDSMASTVLGRQQKRRGDGRFHLPFCSQGQWVQGHGGRNAKTGKGSLLNIAQSKLKFK